MSVSLNTGRSRQKERTRDALVQAAKDLLGRGAPPTVAEAAAAARVSRATAYRYFPTQESLLVEITAVSPAVHPVEKLLEGMTGDDAEKRLERLLETFNRVVLKEEVAMRTALRAYLDTWLAGRAAGETPAVREGRRMRWFDKALEPVRNQLSPAQWRRLRAALALTLGMDAMVVMKDVCRLPDDEAAAVLQWAALALLRAGLAEAKGRRPRKRAPGRRAD